MPVLLPPRMSEERESPMMSTSSGERCGAFSKQWSKKAFIGLRLPISPEMKMSLKIRRKPRISQTFVLGFCGAVGDDV